MKRVRQNKILELIGEYDIDTQEELGSVCMNPVSG